MSTPSAYKLANPEFTFELDGKEYRVRKANLDKAIMYQKRLRELNDAKDDSAHLSIVAYCTYLVLRDCDPSMTEEKVRGLLPADIDPLDILSTLGFISPAKAEKAKAIEEALVKKANS